MSTLPIFVAVVCFDARHGFRPRCVALELQRTNDSPRRRIIRGWGRVVEVPTIVYEMSDDGLMRALGDPRDLALAEVKDRLIGALSDEWASTKDVREALDDPKPSAD